MQKIPKKIFLMHYSPVNTGAVAMAESAYLSLKEKYPNASISIESDYPERTKKMFPGMQVIPRALSIKDIILTKKTLSIEFIRLNFAYIIKTFWVLFVGLIAGLFRIKNTNIEGLDAMTNSDLVISVAGDSISQYYAYPLRFFEFWIISRFNIPNILYAQSVGPFDGNSRKLARIFLGYTTGIIARDQMTIDLMREYIVNTPIYQSVDSAICLPTVENSQLENEYFKYFTKDKKVVGIVIRTDKLTEYSSAVYEEYLDIMNELIQKIVKTGNTIAFIPTIEEDMNATLIFLKKYNVDYPIFKLFKYKASEAKGLLSKLLYVISPRMHPVILSSSSDGYVPVIGLGREFKMEEYLKLIHQTDYFIDYLPLEKKKIFELIERMDKERDKNHCVIEKQMVDLREKSISNIELVDNIFVNHVK